MAASIDPEKHLASSPLQSASKNVDVSPTGSKQVDDNYELFQNARTIEVDPKEAKRVLRKIDIRLMPILFFTYMLQYLDKNSLNFSSVYGLQKGTHLEGQDYSWLGYDLLCMSYCIFSC
jgi:hypothetical protein